MVLTRCTSSQHTYYYIFLYCIIATPHPIYAFANKGRTNGVQFPARRFCLCHRTQTGSGTHHAIYTVSTERSSSGSKRMSEGDYPPLPSAKMKNARDNTCTSLYLHMVRKLRRENLILHVFHSISRSPTHPLLSPVSATRPIDIIFLDLMTVEYQVKRKSLNLNVLQSYIFFSDVFVLRSTHYLRSPVFKLIYSLVYSSHRRRHKDIKNNSN